MYLQVNGAPVYCYTGGKTFDAAKPTVVLIHGVLNDHSVWALQSRYLASHGWNVLAIDLPGHCRSLVIHPASTTHFRMSDEALAGAGITQGTIRLSIGLEDADDLIDDLKRALKAAEKATAKAGV